MNEWIKLANGMSIVGQLMRQYEAFEGGKRYIFRTPNGEEYRCIKDADGNYVEYRP